MAEGRKIDSVFVEIRGDLSRLSGDLQKGVAQSRKAAKEMAAAFGKMSGTGSKANITGGVSKQIDAVKDAVKRAEKENRKTTKDMAAQWSSVSGSVKRLVNDFQSGILTQDQFQAGLSKHATRVMSLGGSYEDAEQKIRKFADATILESQTKAQMAAQRQAEKVAASQEAMQQAAQRAAKKTAEEAARSAKQIRTQWNSVSTSIRRLVKDFNDGVITQGQFTGALNKHASEISKLTGNYRAAQSQVNK